MRICFIKSLGAVALTLAAAATVTFALEPPQDIIVMPPKDGGYTLVKAIESRHSDRTFVDSDFSSTQVAEILWCASGENRENGGLTVPTALGKKEVVVYAVTKQGVYKFLPNEKKALFVNKGDFRKDAGMQDFVGKAAVNLVYVIDKNLLGGKTDADKVRMGAFSAGAMSQNVALFAASKGYGNVVRGSFDKVKLGKALKLSPSEEILMTQSVGPIAPAK